MSGQRDPFVKSLLRSGYRIALGSTVLANALLPKRRGLGVFYGGARSGDIGGPLVKVKRLKQYFPEQKWRYGLVYLLSNTPYLPAAALHVLKRQKIPIIHNQDGVFYPAWYSGDWQSQNSRMAKPYHLADYVFWQSDFCRRSADRFLGERQGPGEILYNAVDTVHFSPRNTQHERKPFTFLVTGKIGRHLAYRVTGPVKALARVLAEGFEARLVIAGWIEAGLRSEVLDIADRLGISSMVELLGPYTQENAPAIYRVADAYIMTKHNDPCPNAVLEALACGLPVVYSASGGVPELVGADAGAGIAAPDQYDVPWWPGTRDLAAAMYEVANHHRIMAAAARNRAVSHFDIGHWIEQHKRVFLRLTKETE